MILICLINDAQSIRVPEQLYENIIEVRERLVLSNSDSNAVSTSSQSDVPVVTGINGEQVHLECSHLHIFRIYLVAVQYTNHI